MNEIIQIDNVSKIINGKPILEHINLSINSGEAFGILGPNGSGKTTLIRTILGLYVPTNGTVLIHGSRINSITKRKLGVVLDSNGLYPRLSAYSNLEFYARIYKLDNMEQRIDKVLDYVGLKDRKFSRVSEFSLGMSRRLAIARAIIHEPDIIIFDEPTNGLDPDGTLLVRNLLINLKTMGKTVLINSHNLSEIEKICDRIAIMHNGQLVLVDAVSNVLNKKEYTIVDIISSNITDKMISLLSAANYVESFHKTSIGIQLKLKGSNYKKEVLKVCNEFGIKEENVKTSNMTLEKIYFELTKGGENLE